MNRRSLMAPPPQPGIVPGSVGKAVSLLRRGGYDVGQPDGAIGTKTKAAIADFEQKQGMPVNGRASVTVLKTLRR